MHRDWIYCNKNNFDVICAPLQLFQPTHPFIVIPIGKMNVIFWYRCLHSKYKSYRKGNITHCGDGASSLWPADTRHPLVCTRSCLQSPPECKNININTCFNSMFEKINLQNYFSFDGFYSLIEAQEIYYFVHAYQMTHSC